MINFSKGGNQDFWGELVQNVKFYNCYTKQWRGVVKNLKIEFFVIQWSHSEYFSNSEIKISRNLCACVFNAARFSRVKLQKSPMYPLIDEQQK